MLSNLRTNLAETQEQLEEEDRELIMRRSPLLTKQLQDSEELGDKRGQRVERMTTIANFFRARFGSVDEELSTIIEPMLQLSSEELTQILMQLSTISREELLSRFGGDILQTVRNCVFCKRTIRDLWPNLECERPRSRPLPSLRERGREASGTRGAFALVYLHGFSEKAQFLPVPSIIPNVFELGISGLTHSWKEKRT